MKKSFLAMLAAITLLAGNSWGQIISNLDDIQFWVGSGSNRSVLIIDFHYGGTLSATQQSWVWGYRWDGSATGEDMISAIAAADSNLDVLSPWFVMDIYYAVGLNYYEGEANYNPGVDLSWGYYLAGGTAEEFNNDWIPQGQVPIPGGGYDMPVSWTISPSGSADRRLSDGSWDAWSFGSYDPNTFVHLVEPAAISHAAIPEPSSILLIGLGSVMLFLRRKKI